MKSTLRRAGILLLALVLLFLTSCGTYKPIKSSETDLRPVMTLGDYTVAYELYRALFFSLKGTYDGGDDTVWTGEAGVGLWDSLRGEAERLIGEIYATFLLCEQLGIDPFGDEMDDTVDEYMTVTVEGGTIDGLEMTGYGSHKAYRAMLEQMHMTDSVYRLLLRYAACQNRLADIYESEADPDDDTLRAFFLSDDCVRISWFYLHYDPATFSNQEILERTQRVHAQLTACSSYEEMKAIIGKNSLTIPTDEIENGFYMGRMQMDRTRYGKVIDAAFSLPTLGISPVLQLADGCYIVIRLEKELSYFNSSEGREEITAIYHENKLFTDLSDICSDLLDGAVHQELYYSLLTELLAGA